jgi:2,3-bisphosphoglycerate-dependent phosphoglycerate mutase
MELYVIRHAQSFNNANPAEKRVEDAPLTALGHQQAKYLAERMKIPGITRLFTSPFRRTLETTEYIKRGSGLIPEVWIDLHEQGGVISGTEMRSYAGRPGMSRAEIEDAFPGYQLPPEIDTEGWWKCKPFEALEEAQIRAERVAWQVIHRFAQIDEGIIFVSHGTFIQLLLGALFGVSVLERDWIGAVLNTAVTKLVITPRHTRLELFNCVCHLPTDLIS